MGDLRLDEPADSPLVLAPDALVRARGGLLLVHTAAGGQAAFECDQPMLIGWLCQFARPTTIAHALAALEPADHAQARALLDRLRSTGVLLTAANAAATAPHDEAAAHALGRQHLRALARSAYDLSCDLQGLGPDAERLVAARDGLGVERRLEALLAAVDGLRGELQAVRAQTLPARLAGAAADGARRGLKLHVGCGQGHLPGWVNIDVHPAPLALNVLAGLPFGDGSASHVFVSHLLEHLYFPRDVQPFLAELRRVLAPGGRVRIVVPDVEQCIAAYAANDRTFFASRRETWPWWPKDPTRLEDFLAYAGAGPEPAYTFEAHKYGYDFETLERVLGAAGFGAVRRCSYMASPDPALRVDDASAVARARYGEKYYSLFVEAEAPR